MTKEQTKNLFRRIKAHYQEFSVDEFKLDEWSKELKDYDYEEVTARFELHLNSESYGELIPKLWFLKKGLKTISEKKENTIFKNPIICNLCGKPIDLRLYDTHYQKCSAIFFVKNECKRIYNKEFTYEQLEKLAETKFSNLYNTILEHLSNKPHFQGQEKIINVILGKEQMTVTEAISNLSHL